MLGDLQQSLPQRVNLMWTLGPGLSNLYDAESGGVLGLVKRISWVPVPEAFL